MSHERPGHQERHGLPGELVARPVRFGRPRPRQFPLVVLEVGDPGEDLVHVSVKHVNRVGKRVLDIRLEWYL